MKSVLSISVLLLLVTIWMFMVISVVDAQKQQANRRRQSTAIVMPQVDDSGSVSRADESDTQPNGSEEGAIKPDRRNRYSGTDGNRGDWIEREQGFDHENDTDDGSDSQSRRDNKRYWQKNKYTRKDKHRKKHHGCSRCGKPRFGCRGRGKYRHSHNHRHHHHHDGDQHHNQDERYESENGGREEFKNLPDHSNQRKDRGHTTEYNYGSSAYKPKDTMGQDD